MLHAYAQTASLQKSLQALREDREERLKDRDSVEAKYRARAPDMCLSQNEVDIKIEKARAAPQKPKLLQAIHLAHTRAVANDDEIVDKEQQLAAQLWLKRQTHRKTAPLRSERLPTSSEVSSMGHALLSQMPWARFSAPYLAF